MRTAEATPDADELADLVARAQAGDADALDGIVRAIQHDVYRLALRMTACVEDAEDATQEVLIKVITRLESFRGDASVRTWAYRIAVRHVLDRKKSRVEELRLTFDAFGADLLDGLAATPEPDPVLVTEVKRGCTLAMLTCLDREHRLAFVLTDVFDLPHAEAAGLCEVGEDVYRQRISRARRALEAFTRSYCGLVTKKPRAIAVAGSPGPRRLGACAATRRFLPAIQPRSVPTRSRTWRACTTRLASCDSTRRTSRPARLLDRVRDVTHRRPS